jgi:hypothetical protein
MAIVLLEWAELGLVGAGSVVRTRPSSFNRTGSARGLLDSSSIECLLVENSTMLWVVLWNFPFGPTPGPEAVSDFALGEVGDRLLTGPRASWVDEQTLEATMWGANKERQPPVSWHLVRFYSGG